MASNLARDNHLLIERIVKSEDRIIEAGAEVIQLDVGRVVRQPVYPHVFDINLVRHPRLEWGDLDQALMRLEAPLREVGAQHLQLSAQQGALSEVLAVELRRRGFYRDRLLAMVLAGELLREPVPGIEVRAVPTEAPFGWFADLIDQMNHEEPWYTPALSREIIGSLELKLYEGVVVPHIAIARGQPVGAAGLAVGAWGGASGVGAITTVGTSPEARRQGVAQTLVLTLAEKAREAGCDLIYLVARADDTPKDMYRKFGFHPATAIDIWLRPPI
jgi:GNAT superfamily N-acetyltransferase